MSISGGAFDGSTGERTARHIFCANKGDHYEIGDGVEQVAQW